MIVWDFPLRLFHWSLFICVVGAIISAKAEVLWVHERFGLAVLGLVTFRVFWGFLGGHYARFGQFLRSPQAALNGLKTLFRPDPIAKSGHSALGGYAVIGLLGIPLFMAITGTMSNDDVLFDGPLAHLVPNMTNKIAEIHHFSANFLFLIIILHLVAILIYKFKKKRNLTMVMVKGKSNIADATLDKDGGISAKQTFFGLIMMVAFIAAAQAITLLRPSLF